MLLYKVVIIFKNPHPILLGFFGDLKCLSLPPSHSNNHAIGIKKGFITIKENIYPLLRKERKKVHEFINEKLKKKYI